MFNCYYKVKQITKKWQMQQNLSLNVAQKLNLSPQLKYAIELLKLSNLEIEDEINKKLLDNPALEVTDESNLYANNITDSFSVEKSYKYKNSKTFFNDSANYENFISTQKTLKEHLEYQLNLTNILEIEKIAGKIIIDSINENGYLISNFKDLYKIIKINTELSFEESLVVLHLIQSFDPIGIGAFDLKESLLIQLKGKYKNNKFFKKTEFLIKNYLNLLAEKKYKQISNKLSINDQDILKIEKIIQSLNPNPGLKFFNNNTEYITPDFTLININNNFTAKINKSYSKELFINNKYQSIIKSNPKSNTYLKEQLIEAKWFLQSIKKREETLLSIVNLIVNYQKDFFINGFGCIKKLTIKDIALALSLNDSTVSRAISNKYISTPHGNIELKYLLSSSVYSSELKQDLSVKLIQEKISQLIRSEPIFSPFSDQEIEKILSKSGIIISRRGITKYRKIMKIPCSRVRKHSKTNYPNK